jgi:hypothetical protein
VIGTILVLGVISIVLLKGSQPSDFPKAADLTNQASPGGDHIHEAYGFNICGKWQTALPEFESQVGIHTHGDGVIHIHPYSITVQGKHAQLKVFLSGAGVRLSNKALVIPKNSVGDGANVKVPGTCPGGKKAVLRVAEWKHATKNNKAVTTPPDKIYTSGFGNIWLGHNGGALTIFYGPADAKIPLPNYDNSIHYLIQAEGGNDQTVTPGSSTPSTTVGSGTTAATTATTTPSTSAGSSTTAAAGG